MHIYNTLMTFVIQFQIIKWKLFTVQSDLDINQTKPNNFESILPNPSPN